MINSAVTTCTLQLVQACVLHLGLIWAHNAKWSAVTPGNAAPAVVTQLRPLTAIMVGPWPEYLSKTYNAITCMCMADHSVGMLVCQAARITAARLW
jgi:hypothetical protein